MQYLLAHTLCSKLSCVILNTIKLQCKPLLSVLITHASSSSSAAAAASGRLLKMTMYWQLLIYSASDFRAYSFTLYDALVGLFQSCVESTIAQQ